ncbi:MAG: pyrimidine-nucleoside phosphorylase [Paenibacillaceae bacterium]
MRMIDLIECKRNGNELTTAEIRFLIEHYCDGSIPDYQMSAWAMAVYLKGMNARETADLTMAMAESGDQFDLSPIIGIKVDKHSTGGVGDTTTLVLAPLVAASGVPVVKMSGRGLGHTGGTIDKLESIEGFQVELDQQAFFEQVNRCGVGVISQTGNITPADKKLYALRDVTATVESIPLIASSIMSKKIATGADAIVLDVKTGAGAFMKTMDDSIELAKAMVAIGSEVGRETIAIISSMDQPLGLAIGNTLEVKEAIETLSGQGPEDLRELCLVLGAYMLLLGQKADSYEAAREQLDQLIDNGQALHKFKELIEAQGGRTDVIAQPTLLPQAAHCTLVSSDHDGWIASIEAEEIGKAAMMLGAGRETKESQIDLSAGIVLRGKVGDKVKAGETLLELHYNDDHRSVVEDVIEQVKAAYSFAASPTNPPPLIYAVVTKDGVIEWNH